MSRRHRLLFAYLGALALALVTVGLQPVAFQKSNAIRAVRTLPELGTGDALDVTNIVGAIPYQPGEVWSVLPAEKYRRTIEEGRGNCSQKTFGLAWWLDREGRPFQVVHLLPLESFLAGGGHTLLRARVDWRDQEQTALVDLRQGALPMSGDRPIDITDLAAGPIDGFHFELLNPGGADSTVYFGAFLDSAVVGVIPDPEIDRYFRFLEAVYRPLGNQRIEKLIYDGLALLLGYYPTIHVIDTDRLFAGRGVARTRYQATLWLLRSALVVLPAFLMMELLPHRERA